MTSPNLILTPCGTSLLTNKADSSQRGLVSTHANAKTPAATESNERQQLENLIERVKTTMQNADIATAKRASAELNGICTFYQDQLPAHTADHHELLCTDTWLGEQTARIVETWLRAQGFTSVNVLRQPDLQTANLEQFQSALSDLVQWCADDNGVLQGYRDSGYRVAFNLTGGFKSVQGFLQTLAHFYADETFYIFEQSDNLLRIPRLPVQLAEIDTIRDNLTNFRRLALGLHVEQDTLAAIPETFLMKIDGEATLSPWGEIVWDKSRKALYEERLHNSPSVKLTYGDTFAPSVADQPPKRKYEINRRVDQLAQVLEKGKKHNVRGLDFKPLKGDPKPPSTHECDAWHDQDAKRLYGRYLKDNDHKTYELIQLDRACH